MDPVNPTGGPLATPPQIPFPALDPATTNTTSNYQLINTTTGIDETQFIASADFVLTAPDFVSPPGRVNLSDPFAGRIDLTFNVGLPGGHYVFIAHTNEGSYYGLRDAAGNPLSEPGTSGPSDFFLNLNIQPEPVFITNMAAVDSDNNSTVVGGPRSFYEVPTLGVTPRGPAPPTALVIDLSNPLNPNANYTDAVQLIRSNNGDFGTLVVAGLGSSGTGFTRITGVTITLADKTTGAQSSGVARNRRTGSRAPGGRRQSRRLGGAEAGDPGRPTIGNLASRPGLTPPTSRGDRKCVVTAGGRCDAHLSARTKGMIFRPISAPPS